MRIEFPIKIYRSVSRNLPVTRNLPSLNLQSRHKNLMAKKNKKSFLSNIKKPKVLKKGQKLQICPEKSQSGNTECDYDHCNTFVFGNARITL